MAQVSEHSTAVAAVAESVDDDDDDVDNKEQEEEAKGNWNIENVMALLNIQPPMPPANESDAKLPLLTPSKIDNGESHEVVLGQVSEASWITRVGEGERNQAVEWKNMGRVTVRFLQPKAEDAQAPVHTRMVARSTKTMHERINRYIHLGDRLTISDDNKNQPWDSAILEFAQDPKDGFKTFAVCVKEYESTDQVFAFENTAARNEFARLWKLCFQYNLEVEKKRMSKK